MAKNPPANAGDLRDVGSVLGQEDVLEEGSATRSSILAWKIPWTIARQAPLSMEHKESGMTSN